MTNATPIILDRLSTALTRHGVSLKRGQLLEVASYALGKGNAHVFSLAAKDGDFDPPKAVMAQDHVEGMTTAMDPIARLPFSFMANPADGRQGRWVISPYGNMLDVSALNADAKGRKGNGPSNPASPVGTITVEVATVSHRHGVNSYVAATEAALEAELADYCAQYWNEALAMDSSLAATPDGMSDEDIVSAYFDAVADETLDRSSATLEMPNGSSGETVEVAAEKPSTPAIEHTTRELECRQEILARPIKVIEGLVFDRCEIGMVDGYRVAVLHAQTEYRNAYTAWNDDQLAMYARTGVAVTVADGTMTVSLPWTAGVNQAAGPVEWRDAIADLLVNPEERPRIHARFTPEAWVNDYATEVDAEGNVFIDITFEMLLIGREEALTIASEDADDLKDAVRAPRWIRDWQGPFTISVHGGVTDAQWFTHPER